MKQKVLTYFFLNLMKQKVFEKYKTHIKRFRYYIYTKILQFDLIRYFYERYNCLFCYFDFK